MGCQATRSVRGMTDRYATVKCLSNALLDLLESQNSAELLSILVYEGGLIGKLVRSLLGL
jgi:hypothetical protein